ncbi:hypothetical protein L3556_09525 [Candidatus Synechococcus calcipolaris G9]|uniref:Chromosome partition protein Smc n=1 Tax=Candidatus Synechococcus calcipolaris G9 TaxID=1497997 RepID=A0ABT6EZX3_9SYNE|nr:hypothetical protein [Candidatus Synechococcus calcipolaris]MDG2991165.1 hypothetical protein [Candidatus Synechococcus calcipolaris G9]
MQEPHIPTASEDVLRYEYIENAIRAYQRQLTFDLAVKLGENIGWTLDSDQGKGSHQCLKKNGQTVILSQPNGDTYVIGTARRILKQIFQPLVDSGQLKTHQQEQLVQEIEEHLDETLTWFNAEAVVSLQDLQERYEETISNVVPNLEAAEALVDELQVIIEQKDQQLAQLALDVQRVQTEQQGMELTQENPDLTELGNELGGGEALPENVDLDRLISDLAGDQSSGDLRDIQGGLSIDEEIARISELAGTEVFSRNQELEQQVQQLNAEIQRLQGERQDVQTQLDAAQNLVQTLQEQVQNLETTAIAHDHLQQAHGELLAQVQQLQSQEVHRHDLEEQVSNFAMEQASLQEQLTTLEQINQTLREQLDQQPDADVEPEESEQLHGASTAVEQGISWDSDDNSDDDDTKSLVKYLSKQVDYLNDQVKYLNEQLDVSQAAVNPLQERIASLQAQLAEVSTGEQSSTTDIQQEQQLNRQLKRLSRRQENVNWIASMAAAVVVALPMVPSWGRPLAVLAIPVAGAIAKQSSKK